MTASLTLAPSAGSTSSTRTPASATRSTSTPRPLLHVSSAAGGTRNARQARVAARVARDAPCRQGRRAHLDDARGVGSEAWRGARLNQPGKPTRNAHLASVNGRFRHECLSQHRFPTLARAGRRSKRSRVDYNRVRPHTSLDYRTPEAFGVIARRRVPPSAAAAAALIEVGPPGPASLVDRNHDRRSVLRIRAHTNCFWNDIVITQLMPSNEFAVHDQMQSATRSSGAALAARMAAADEAAVDRLALVDRDARERVGPARAHEIAAQRGDPRAERLLIG